MHYMSVGYVRLLSQTSGLAQGAGLELVLRQAILERLRIRNIWRIFLWGGLFSMIGWGGVDQGLEGREFGG